jgi:hypothetical protein
VRWSAAREWSAALDLRIGSVDDSVYALTAFTRMEVGTDGTMYTLHGSERVVRMFDRDGSLLGVLGGPGEGPGEFQSPGPMGWLADTLWVLDYRGYRFSLFSPAGAYLSSFSVPFATIDDPAEIQPPRASGLLFDGTVWGEPPAFSNMVADGTITHRTLLAMTRDGEVGDTLGSVAIGRNQWGISEPESERQAGMYRNQPYADGPLWWFAADEHALIVVDREAPASPELATLRVSKIGFDGDTLFAVVVAFEPLAIDAAEVDSILDAVGESLAQSPFFGVTPARGRVIAEATLYRPALRPGATELRIAKDGGIWIAGVPDGLGRTEWLVLDRDGRPTGRVGLSSRVNPLVIEPPLLWGAERGELDVPYVVRYRIEAR